MAFEFVIVSYPTNRLAYIDGTKCGYTNSVLRVEPGTHVFSLGSFTNYTPESLEIKVENTTVFEPLEIIFSKKDA